jgi:hypothetical protein
MLDARTGELRENHYVDPDRQIGEAKWCVDEGIYRSETNKAGSTGKHWHQVVRRDPATGSERVVIDDPAHRVFGCVDRKQLVAGFEPEPDEHTGGPYQFALVDIATGARTPLVTAGALAVSRDGATIIYSTSSNDSSEIWSRPVRGGSPQRLAAVPGHVSAFEFHPDGRQFVVETSSRSRTELWSYTLPVPEASATIPASAGKR